MKSTNRNDWLGLVALAAIGLPCAPASAQLKRADVTTTLHSTGVFVPAYEVQMLFHPEPPEDHPVRPVVNGRALSEEEFALLKARQMPRVAYKPGIPRNHGPGGIEPQVAGYLYETNGLNATQTGGWYPPDDSFAISPKSAIQPANVAVGLFARSSSGLALESLTDGNTFMNFPPSDSSPFDPRAMYDYKTGHFFISYSSFTFKDTKGVYHAFLLLAVSTTSNAMDPWVTYALDTIPATGVPTSDQGLNFTYDYPDIGMDANNVYVTANIFGQKNYYGATMIAFDKASLEAGNANVPTAIYNGLGSSLTPPYVWSQGKSKQSYFIFDQPYSLGPTSHTGYIGMYAVSGKVVDNSIRMSNATNVVVPYYEVPALAEQPGLQYEIETLDTRFQDKTNQLGENVYAANCVSILGFPMITAYEMNGYYGTLLQTLNMISSPTSFDFNASIAVNSKGVAVVNWNATDVSKEVPADNIYESIRTVTLNGAWGTKPRPGTLVPGATSSQAYEFYRNGDYSMTVLDPLNSNNFWGIDQTVMDEYDWNTYIFELSVP